MVQQAHDSSSSLPSFLQTEEGKLSLPTLVGVIISAMVAAILFTIAVYIVVVRNFHKFFEAKERVAGHHMNFFQAVEYERRTSPVRQRQDFSSSSSSNTNNNDESSDFDEDFENVEEIRTPKDVTRITPQRQRGFLTSPREKNLYLSSAREITV